MSVSFTVMHTEALAQQSGDTGWAGNDSYPYNANAVVNSFSPAETADVVIQSAPSFVQAKIPKKVKESVMGKLLKALF